MIKKIKYCYLPVLLLASFSLSGQDLKTDLDKEILTLRTKEYSAINTFNLLKYDHKILLDSIKKYDRDALANIRFNVQELEYKIACENPKDSTIKNEVIRRLKQNINDSDILIWQHAVKKLLTFSSSDFGKKAPFDLNEIIIKNKLNKDLILLIGLCNNEEQKKYLISNVRFNSVISFSEFNSTNWAIQLALARMGDQESISYCIEKVDNFNDSILKVTLLLSDLGYTRSNASVLYIKKYLYSNNRLPSTHRGIQGSQYCQFAMQVLAPAIKDFPVKEKLAGYSTEEIETARKWMDNQKQFNIKR